MTDTRPAPLMALAPWYGGKRTLAPRIVAEFGAHRAYWEPMAGSMAVLFAKPRIAFETVNDLHGDLVTLAMVLASERWQDLCAAALRTLPAEPLYAHHRDRLRRPHDPPPSPDHVGPADVGRALSYLVVSWQGLNGTAGTNAYNQHWSVRWTASGGRWGWASVPESIPWWHQRLRAVSVLRRDAFDVLGSIADEAGTVIYCDPPYVAKGDKYVHDFQDADHERLAGLLGRFTEARVVVSYYDHPEIRRLYDGWTLVPLGGRKALAHAARPGKRATRDTAPEILLVNGPSLVARQGRLFSAAAAPSAAPATPASPDSPCTPARLPAESSRGHATSAQEGCA